MSRSTWKVPYISNIFFSNLLMKKKNFKIWQRNSCVPANFVNRRYYIHNGIWLLTVNIKSGMIGHKFGEFSFTKRMGKEIHFKKKQKKKK